ncbi:MAG TPA: hypothetical protein VNZ85_19945 [Caulobacter sp.]|nr:hypothetical protein [Caulobacter sp.]
MAVYTFVCLTRNQVASLVDVQDLPDEACRHHALGLLREHTSTGLVEIWREDSVIEVVDRHDARTLAS